MPSAFILPRCTCGHLPTEHQMYSRIRRLPNKEGVEYTVRLYKCETCRCFKYKQLAMPPVARQEEDDDEYLDWTGI